MATPFEKFEPRNDRRIFIFPFSFSANKEDLFETIGQYVTFYIS